MSYWNTFVMDLTRRCEYIVFVMNFLLGAMTEIYNNIINDEGVIRDRALGFLASKTKYLLAEEILTKDVEEAFIRHCRKVRVHFSREFLILLMPNAIELFGILQKFYKMLILRQLLGDYSKI